MVPPVLHGNSRWFRAAIIVVLCRYVNLNFPGRGHMQQCFVVARYRILNIQIVERTLIFIFSHGDKFHIC